MSETKGLDGDGARGMLRERWEGAMWDQMNELRIRMKLVHDEIVKSVG
jgi:hypothetical protein